MTAPVLTDESQHEIKDFSVDFFLIDDTLSEIIGIQIIFNFTDSRAKPRCQENNSIFQERFDVTVKVKSGQKGAELHLPINWLTYLLSCKQSICELIRVLSAHGG